MQRQDDQVPKSSTEKKSTVVCISFNRMPETEPHDHENIVDVKDDADNYAAFFDFGIYSLAIEN